MPKEISSAERNVTRRIVDPDVQALAAISGTLRADYASDDLAWHGSPFAWIKTRPSRQVGVVGERLVAGWLAAKDLDVIKSPDSEADRVVNGRRAEIKFSTIWAAGFYKFQQLRDQDYDFVICLGLSPFDAHCWAIPKRIILDRWKAGDIEAQHGGKKGKDTAWLTVRPGAEPAWLRSCGGSLSSGFRSIASITSRS